MRLSTWRRRFPLIFESQGFRWLWSATLVSKLGDWMGFVALNLYVFNLTGSATALAGVLAVEAVPSLLIGPVAGVIVDRFSRRQIMIVANLAAASAFILLPLTTSLWQIYVLALLTRSTTTFFNPAQRALIPDLVGKDKALIANSTVSVIVHITLIAGPALAGVLIAFSGVALAFWVNAATFVIANGFIARIKGEIPKTQIGDQPAPGLLDDLKTGLQYAFSNKALRVLLITTFVSSIAAATLVTIEVVYVTDTLNGGDEGYALLLSVAGIGALFASINVTRLSQRFTLTGLYVTSVLITGLTFFPYANVHILWFVIIVAGLQTVPWMIGRILIDTLLQQWVADEVRGRIFSLIETERNAGQVLVAAIFAPFIDLWGPVVILNISGVIYTIAGVYVVLQLGVLRSVGDTLLPEAT